MTAHAANDPRRTSGLSEFFADLEFKVELVVDVMDGVAVGRRRSNISPLLDLVEEVQRASAG